MCVSESFAKFLRAPVSENICKRLFLKIGNFSFLQKFMSFEVQSCLNQMVRAENCSSGQVKKNIAERKTFGNAAGK